MGLQAIQDAIQENTRARIEEVEALADQRVREIIAQAKAEAEQLRAAARAETANQVVKECARLIYRAQLEALRIRSESQAALTDTLLEQLRERLATLRWDPVYPQIIEMLIRDTRRQFHSLVGTDEPAFLAADPRDRELIMSIIGRLGWDVSVEYSLTCWGGLNAWTAGKGIMLANSLESRLGQATPYLRSYFLSLTDEAQEVVA